MRKQTIATVIVAAFIGVTMFVVRHTQNLNNAIKIKQIELRDNSAQLQLLDDKYKRLNEDLNKTGADKQKIEEQLKQLQDEKKSLQEQLQAKLDAKQKDIASRTQTALIGSQKASAANIDSKMFIYMHESGNRPSAVALNGACGLGQALPCSKLPCSLADYGCQDSWFTSYMQQRYGTWDNAKAFWVSKASWNGSDYVGGWW